MAGKSFSLEEVPKLQIEIQTSEGKIDIGKDFRFVKILTYLLTTPSMFDCTCDILIFIFQILFLHNIIYFLRQELLNKFTFCSGQTAQRHRRVTESLALPPCVPPMFEMKVWPHEI